MMTDAMNCDALHERLSDYLEDELSLADRRAVEVHLATCLRCAALVRDLDAIRSDASALPELTPSRDLWNGIAERIEAPVVPLPSTPVVVMPAYRRRAFDRLRLAAVAAALVAVTAGVTYTLTIARSANSPAQVATVGPLDSSTTADTAGTPRDVAPPAPEQLASTDTTVIGDDTATQPLRPTAQPVRNAPAAVTSSREIDRLRTIFTQNRNQLDPRTAAIIEANLKVIDEAIAQSKAALSQDPASRFLNDQLNSALDKKLELLRTAARLPQRT